MVKCGNHKRHGNSPVYHATGKLTRACFEGGNVYNLTREGTFLPVPAPTVDPVKANEVFARLRRARENGLALHKAAQNAGR